MIRIVEGFASTSKPRKRGRPLGSKNKPGHKAGGRKKKSVNFLDAVVAGTKKFLESPFK